MNDTFPMSLADIMTTNLGEVLVGATPHRKKVVANHYKLVTKQPEGGFADFTFCCDNHKKMARSIWQQAFLFTGHQIRVLQDPTHVIPERVHGLSERQFATYKRIMRKEAHEQMPETRIVEAPAPQEYVPSTKVRTIQCTGWNRTLVPGAFTADQLKAMNKDPLCDLLKEHKVQFNAKAKKELIVAIAIEHLTEKVKLERCTNQITGTPVELGESGNKCPDHKTT